MPWLVISELSINVARGIFSLALGMLLYNESNSLWAFTLVFASEFAIGLFIQGYAGSVVDRIGGSKVLLLASLASVAVIGLPLFLVRDIGMIELMTIAFGLNVFRPFIRNSIFVLIPEIVKGDRLEKLNAYVSIAIQAGQIIGMALAGILLELFDSIWAIRVVFLGYLTAFIFYNVTINKHQHHHKVTTAPKNDKGSWLEVRNFLTANPLVVWIYGVASLDYLALALFNLLLAPAVKHNFDNLPRWLTFIDASFAIGAIFGGVYIARQKISPQHRLKITMLSMAIVAALFLGYAYDISAYGILLCTFCFGISTSLSTVSWMSEQQRLAPGHIKGRLASIRYIANACMASMGTVIVSFVNDFSFAQAAISAAVMMSCLSLIALIFRSQQAKSPTESTVIPDRTG